MMLQIGPITILSLSILLSVAGAWSHVAPNQLSERLARQQHSLVAFVSPSAKRPISDASTALEAEWTMVQDTEPTVMSIDCSQAAQLCAKERVANFPTIRLYVKDGSMQRYRGPRKAPAIITFLRRALRPTISYLDHQNMTSFHSIDDVVFVAHFPPEDENLHRRFEILANRYRDRFSFGLTSVPHPPAGISCYNNIDNMQHSTAELSRPESLAGFIKLCSSPLVPQLTRRNEMQHLKSGKSLVYYFSKSDTDTTAYTAMIRPLAQKYAEYLTFVTVDADEHPEMLPGLGLRPGVTPALSLQNPRMGQVFPYEEGKQINWAAIETFIIDISNGKVKPWDGVLQASVNTLHDEL